MIRSPSGNFWISPRKVKYSPAKQFSIFSLENVVSTSKLLGSPNLANFSEISFNKRFSIRNRYPGDELDKLQIKFLHTDTIFELFYNFLIKKKYLSNTSSTGSSQNCLLDGFKKCIILDANLVFLTSSSNLFGLRRDPFINSDIAPQFHLV